MSHPYHNIQLFLLGPEGGGRKTASFTSVRSALDEIIVASAKQKPIS